MKKIKLKLLAVGDKLVNDYETLDLGIIRYVGRKWDAKLKGFPPIGVSEVNAQGEYVKAVQNGDLMPADQETAQYCGVAFNQSYADASIADLNQSQAPSFLK